MSPITCNNFRAGVASSGLMEEATRDVRSPFGGVTASGFDREYGAAGLCAYTEFQSIAV
ncbi:hypothetical protein ACIBL8_47240 [Streptomyces sp. NPDC050523]|uniref:hypothetical protein n=1 Tax=Streptomyces sp. NPDC050523 TaxID=3365622 RepID=UPI0037AE9A3C